MMGREETPSFRKELDGLIARYEAAKAENRQLYLDGCQIADIIREYVSDRRYDEALEAVGYGLYLHPGNTDILIEKSYLYLDRGETEKAGEIADSIADESSPDVKMLKAEILVEKGDPERADALLKEAEVEDDVESLADIVCLFLDTGHPEYAKEWLDRAGSRYDDDESYLSAKADYLSATDQSEKAVACYDRLIDKDPYNPSYWTGMARCCFTEGNIEKAIEACDFALVADESCGEAFFLRAHCYFYLGDPDRAVENYRKAIELDAVPAGMGYMFIGMSYSLQREWEKANLYYDKVLEIFRGRKGNDSFALEDTYANKIEALARSGKHKEAHELCEEARMSLMYDDAICLAEARLYLSEDQDKEAARAFGMLLERRSDVNVYYMIALIYSEFDYLEDARGYYEKVYRMDPGYEDVRERLAVIYLMLRNVEKFVRYNRECECPIGEGTAREIMDGFQKKGGDRPGFYSLLKLYQYRTGKG